MEDVDPAWLEPTWFLDAESVEIEAYASAAVGAATDPTEMAIKLFYAVRDGLRYDPYGTDRSPESYKASAIAQADTAWCVPKSVLLTAAARNCGIPARLGFADVKNHLTSEKLQASMGTKVFAWHGYSQLLLDGRWFKLSTAFNIELCQKFGTRALEFDGTDDALMHPFDESGNRHMEYVKQRGTFDDLPLNAIFASFAEIYPSMSFEGAGTAAAGDEAFSPADSS
ncbi:MAG: transglutaminase family protein [Acidimicrobiales bacterium]|nr:transglutaminase family protein [Acidimicrobiales bacterium]MDG1878205.1 transglutaminase family protein [Acidimicrobiales bacterium]